MYVHLDFSLIATFGPEERPILFLRDEGWAEEWLYFQSASQPTTYLTKYSKWNISATTDRIFLKFQLKLMGPTQH